MAGSPFSFRSIPSHHCDERPVGIEIDTIILHTMYCPDAPNPFQAEACKGLLDSLGFSAHYLIERDGSVAQLVEEKYRAWHAGKSRIPDEADGRERVNDFSIGIEAIANEAIGLTDAQYQSLASLCAEITVRHPIRQIWGHVHIAPDRKSDPWQFDWRLFSRELSLRTPRPVRLPPEAAV